MLIQLFSVHINVKGAVDNPRNDNKLTLYSLENGLRWRQDFMGNLIGIGYFDEVFNKLDALLVLQIKVQYIPLERVYQRWLF